MGRKKTQFETSALMNSYSYTKYLLQLKELAVSMFEWKNLPPSVDERFLEVTLFEQGKAVYFDDEVLGNLALRCTVGGGFDVYNVPIVRRAYANNGYNRVLDNKNSVIIYNNYCRTNTLADMTYYAMRLWDIDRTIDINVKAQKTPILIECTEEEKLSMEQTYMSYTGNQPVLAVNKNFNSDGFKVLRTDAPFVADKLMQIRNQIWNECMTILGISNVNFQKKERLVADEVIRGQGGTIANRYTRLNERRRAAEQINKMFGTKIEVDYREDFRQTDDEFMIEGETNGEYRKAMVVDSRTTSK